MVLKLYTQDMSPPCRSVHLTAAALGLELELIIVDVWKKEQFSETYLKLNPHHTIPTLDDEGTIICDSHAINIYLVSKYGKDDSLYPNDVKIRAAINECLFYNSGVVFSTSKHLILKIARKQVIDENLVLEIQKIYELLEIRLKNTAWFGGDSVTIADFAINPNIRFFNLVEPLHQKKYPKLLKWLENIKKMSYFHVSEKGIKDLEEFVFKRLNTKSSL